jgi:hypothetical protein
MVHPRLAGLEIVMQASAFLMSARAIAARNCSKVPGPQFDDLFLRR